MNDSTTRSAAGKFPTFRKLFGWLFGWRMIRRYLFALVCLATLLALYYAEENWRGRRAWNKYRSELEARGAQLDYHAFIPKTVADDQNFAATPFIKSWFLKAPVAPGGAGKPWPDDDYLRVSQAVSTSNSAEEGGRQFMNLVAWGMGFSAIRSGELKSHQEFKSDKLDLESRAKAAPAVLEGLKGTDSVLAELRVASQRPYSRYPVVYDLDNPWGILLPHLANVKGACQRLQLKACAELAVGQSDLAFEDVKLALYLTDSLSDEPFLVSYLIRLACFRIATQPIWEGSAEHRWSDTQLREFQTRLQRYNFFADLNRPLEGERAAGILTVDLLIRKKYRLSELGGGDSNGGDLADGIARVAPNGWYYLEQLSFCRLYQDQLQGAFDATQKRVSPDQIANNARELERQISGGRLGKGLKAVLHHQLIASLLLPELNKIPMKAAMAQTTADQAALACALERFRTGTGQFPEKLDALVPRFISQLPGDVITGEALKYRRTNDGGFFLYSVGWNQKDDGGITAKSMDSPGRAQDFTQGDWVWRSSEK